MRIFLNMGLTEHTGHGIPTIVNKYGKEAFEIESDYIRCIIPFEKDILEQINNKNVGLNVGLNKTERKESEYSIQKPNFVLQNNKNVGLSVGLNVGLNKTERKVIEYLMQNSSLTSEILAEKIGVTKRIVERAFSTLQEKRMIERVGSKRDGRWK